MIQLSINVYKALQRGCDMKLMVIGLGRCGVKIADEFAKLNKKARAKRGLDIITDIFAVDTDPADLNDLRTIKLDFQHRILIESPKTDGGSIVRMSEIGAGVTMENSSRVLDAIRATGRLFEADAFLIIASVAGGTGSGGMPVLAQTLKDCYQDKPVYALAVLPFQDEEAEEEQTAYNSAISLKTIHSVADAVFVSDNQRYIIRDPMVKEKPRRINELIVEPFYDLLCAGEEAKAKHIGVRTADFGNIRETLTGWTAISYGQSLLSPRGLFGRWRSFRSKSADRHAGIQAMEAAIGQLPVDCQLADAERALYLVLAPAAEMRPELFQELGGFLKSVSRGAVIRGCDYPLGRGAINVTVVLSGLTSVERIKRYYDIVGGLVRKVKKQQEEAEKKARAMEAAANKIPSLL
jgi:cell division GTPase FtsZ